MGNDEDRKILYTKPGAGTADTVYYCDDGTVWVTAHTSPPSGGTSGTVRGYVDGNRMRVRVHR